MTQIVCDRGNRNLAQRHYSVTRALADGDAQQTSGQVEVAEREIPNHPWRRLISMQPINSPLAFRAFRRRNTRIRAVGLASQSC